MDGENRTLEEQGEEIAKELYLSGLKRTLQHFEEKHGVRIEGIVKETGAVKFVGVSHSNTSVDFDGAVKTLRDNIMRRLEETKGELPEGYYFIEEEKKPLVGESYGPATTPGSKTDLE